MDINTLTANDYLKHEVLSTLLSLMQREDDELLSNRLYTFDHICKELGNYSKADILECLNVLFIQHEIFSFDGADGYGISDQGRISLSNKKYLATAEEKRKIYYETRIAKKTYKSYYWTLGLSILAIIISIIGVIVQYYKD